MNAEDYANLGLAEQNDLAERDTDELVEMYQAVEQYLVALRDAKAKIEAQLVLVLDTPKLLADGRRIRAYVDKQPRAWNKDKLRDALTHWAGRPLLDTETGESMWALDPVKAMKVFEPATGRKSVLTKDPTGPQLKLEDFCEVVERAVIKVD